MDDIDLFVSEGESVGLVGESGSGKTTTALSIMRLLPPTARIVSGRILLSGKNLAELTEEEMRRVRGKQIAMIFQDPSTYLNPSMSVGDQIAENMIVAEGMSRREAKVETISLFRKVRLPDADKIYSNYPFQLSGGMQQRVMIAIALSRRPRLLIADEPTSNLDVTVQAKILTLMKQLSFEENISLLMITHDLGIIAGYCSRLYVMYLGKIVESGDTRSLFHTPKHPYFQALLDAVRYSSHETVAKVRDNPPDSANPPQGCRFHPRCPFAMKICTDNSPPLIRSENNQVACWLYGNV